MEVTGTVDMVGRGTEAMVDTECLSWADMAVTGHLSLVLMAAVHIMRLCHRQLQRRKFKDCSAGTAVLLSTEPGSSVVDVVRPFSDFRNSQEAGIIFLCLAGIMTFDYVKVEQRKFELAFKDIYDGKRIDDR